MQRGIDHERGKRLPGDWREPVAQGGAVLGKERGKAGVNALDLHVSRELLGLGVSGAAGEEDGGRGIGRQRVAQVAAEKVRGHQRVLNAAQPRQSQVAQTPAHGIADEERAGQSGCGDSRPQQQP